MGWKVNQRGKNQASILVLAFIIVIMTEAFFEQSFSISDSLERELSHPLGTQAKESHSQT